MTGHRFSATALVSLLTVALSAAPACSRVSSSHAEAVAPAALQAGIAAKLAQDATPASWVDCPKELPAAVGRTTRCIVTFGATDSATVLLTTTQVTGDNVDWEITDVSLTKEQLARRVGGLTSGQGAVCDSGLDGRMDESTVCDLKVNGVPVRLTVEPARIKGLRIDLKVIPVLSAEQVQEMLLSKLTATTGFRPESANCSGDLIGVKGTVLQCTVTADQKKSPYLLTVTDTTGGMVDFSYALP